MGNRGIRNPLGITQLVTRFTAELCANGYELYVSDDMKKLDEIKQKVRGERIGPMHDMDVCSFGEERAFWVGLMNGEGTFVGIQAFRFDRIDTNLADWLPNYMIGVYMRRQELLVPSHIHPPAGSIAEKLSGDLVYCGELWLDKQVKGRNIFDSFTRIGLLLCLIKWNPNAIWGLASEQMARHGHVGRIGYVVLERGFLRWQWKSKGIDDVEYLALVDRDSLENMIDEMLTTTS